LAKTVALLVVTWLVWFSGSLRLLPHTRGTILLGFLVLAVISGLLLWRKRTEMVAWAKDNVRHIAIVELLGVLLFGLMLFIRWGNPDLWHPNFGGEKPMDFSYFNAVLKSTYFPPYDPWLAGGYLNYYYYGFVVAGLLTKLLGVVPALAYNLILPMLFSLVGLNAFCAAYNLVARVQNTEHRTQSTEASERLAVSGEPVASDVQPLAAPDETAGALQAVAAPPKPISQSSNSPYLPYIAGIAATLMVVVLGNLGQIRTFTEGFKRAAGGGEGWGAVLNGITRVASGQTILPVGTGSWYWDATRIVPGVNGSGSEITEFPFFTFIYADLHAHMIVMPFTVLAVVWAINYLLSFKRVRGWLESLALWAIGGLTIGVTRPSNTWDYPMYLALGLAAILSAHFFANPRFTRASLWSLIWRVGLLVGLTIGLYRPFDQWVAVPLTELKLWENERTPLEAYFYIYGLFFFLIVSWLLLEVRRWLAETPVTILDRAAQWLPSVLMALGAFFVSVLAFLLMGVRVASVALPLIALAGLLILRGPSAMALEKRAVLFLFGTGLAVTIFVDVAVLGGDRMNTIFKLYMQVWFLLSIAAGAALAWVLAEAVNWRPVLRNIWTVLFAVLVGSAALYTVTAANAKMLDRFPGFAVSPEGAGCQAIPNMVQPYEKAPDPNEQPRGLYGLNYMTFGAYCDEGYFLPLKYDYEAIRWLQDNVQGSPVLLEAQNFNLYRITSRYAWNTGLPNVVGWDWHQRQQRGAGPTQYISERGAKVSLFYCAGMSMDDASFQKYRVCQSTLQFWSEAGNVLSDPSSADAWAERFLREYEVKYIVVGTLERAYYPPEGLAKLERMLAAGQLVRVFENEGVTIYEVLNNATATN
jgi:YYY domain-containing protein